MNLVIFVFGNSSELHYHINDDYLYFIDCYTGTFEAIPYEPFYMNEHWNKL